MKAIILPRNIFILFAFALLSFADPYTVKRISDKDFRYEFYTTDKKIKPNKSQMYSWFKGGLIHEAQGGIAGDLLNDTFIKMYHSNQLAEEGKFKNGLRVGVWKTWHQNGVLATDQNWDNGLRSGIYLSYDTNGNLIEKGRFVANYKTGKWINIEKQDTVTYKKGIVVVKDETHTKSEKYKIKQDKINSKNATKVQKELDAIADAAKLDSYKAEAKEEEKARNASKKDSKLDVFYKSLFKKKDKAPQ